MCKFLLYKILYLYILVDFHGPCHYYNRGLRVSIWPHGKDKLDGFLQHLNSIPNIVFTMGLEEDRLISDSCWLYIKTTMERKK